MLVFLPGLSGDVGFWLSVSATGGILWLYKPIKMIITQVICRMLRGVKNKAFVDLVEVLSVDLSSTLAAQIATFPILLGVFGHFPLVSPLVNMLILWLVPIIMALGALKVFFGLVSSLFGYCLGFVVWVPLNIFVMLINFFGGYSGLSEFFPALKVSESGWVVVTAYLCYYLMLFGVVFKQNMRKKRLVDSLGGGQNS